MEQQLKNKQVKIEYTRPKMHRRIFASLIDMMLLVFVFIAMFLLTRQIVISVPYYKEVDKQVVKDRTESGLYIEYNGHLIDKMTYLGQIKDFSSYARMTKARESIEQFIEFMGEKAAPETYTKIKTDYRNFLLNDKLVYNDVPYFIEVEGKIKMNPDCDANNEQYFKNVYAPYADVNCQNFLIKYCPNYYENIKFISNMTLFVEIPIGLTLSGILVYLVPPLIMKRGRLTIGKKIYKIGAVNSKDYYNVSTGKTIARFCIFFFGIVLLSFFTIGVPIFVSFSMMAFSKRHQSFPDYMLGIEEIDLNDGKVYFSKEDALMDVLENTKPAIDFKLEETI